MVLAHRKPSINISSMLLLLLELQRKEMQRYLFGHQILNNLSESEVAQSCWTLRNPMDCRLPGSSIRGIFQARVLEWGAIDFSKGNGIQSHSNKIDNVHSAHCDFSAHGLEFILLSINPRLSQCPNQESGGIMIPMNDLLINTTVNFHSFQFSIWPIPYANMHLFPTIKMSFVLYTVCYIFCTITPPPSMLTMPLILLQKACSVPSCNFANSEDVFYVILEAGARRHSSHSYAPGLREDRTVWYAMAIPAVSALIHVLFFDDNTGSAFGKFL